LPSNNKNVFIREVSIKFGLNLVKSFTFILDEIVICDCRKLISPACVNNTVSIPTADEAFAILVAEDDTDATTLG
jgi:hypothetical protein